MNISPQPPQPSRAVAGKPLHALLAGLAKVAPHHNLDITGLSLDSRQVKENDLFIAVPGEARDGRDYIHSAIRNGASAIAREQTDHAGVEGNDATVPHFDIVNLKEQVGTIAARFFAHPSAHMRLLGITGTNGKTTCAYLLTQALNNLGQRCALMSTIGNGFLGELQPATLTTADAISTQRILATLLSAHATAVCMEVSSHGLAQGRVQHVAFEVALFTNLSRDHLDYHGSMKGYRQAKQKLFEFAGLECAVINSDDPFGQQLLHTHGAARCVSYGMQDGKTQPDVRLHNLELNATGITFAVEYRGQVERINCGLIGAVNVPNLLATIATLLACGYPLEQIATSLATCLPPPGRMELLPKRPSQPCVVIDYAHTPDALHHALSSLAEFCQGKLTVVFGCGGDRDHGKRPLMGKIAESLADRVIITDDNPRSESPQQITAQIVSGMHTKPTILHARQSAIETAIQTAADEDIVLIAGKGHETTQTIGSHRIDFNDRDIASATLERMAANHPSSEG